MLRRVPNHVLLSILLLPLMTACSPDFVEMGEKRLETSRENLGSIEIVAMRSPNESDAYINGILLASKEINQRANKLLGRPLKVHVVQEGETFEDTKSSIRRVVANPKITAVLGHRRSSIAIPASVIYERSQVIFITPFATAKKLTGHGFKYVFRMVPNNDVMAEQLSSVAKTLGYQRMVTLYARDDLSREIAFLFEDAAIKQGIKLTKSASFFEKETNYRPIISQFNSEPFDAVFLAAPAKPAALMVRQLREMGINTPILGSDSLNKSAYTKDAGYAANDTIVPSVYYPSDNNVIATQFIKKYKELYEIEADYNAAQGYDSTMLLAAAIEQAGSTLPPLLNTTLHYMPAWIGVTGIHAFDEHGEIKGKKYFFNVWQENKWQNLPAIHIPYLIKRFTKRLKLRTDYHEVFTRRMHDDEHKTHLIALSQKVLGFRNVGLIYEDTEAGRITAGYPLLASLERQKKIKINACQVPLSDLEEKEAERAITACYGKLSLNSEALFIPSYYQVDGVFLKSLNDSLRFFKIPAFSLDRRNVNQNISLLMTKRSDITTDGIHGMQVYSSLLRGMKVHEFSDRLKNLPEIIVNLDSLQDQGIADQPLLELSPDDYIHSSPFTQQEEILQ